MNEIISFFSDIFCANSSNGMKVGLSQFKDNKVKDTPVKSQKVTKSETKLSDLMRGA